MSDGKILLVFPWDVSITGTVWVGWTLEVRWESVWPWSPSQGLIYMRSYRSPNNQTTQPPDTEVRMYITVTISSIIFNSNPTWYSNRISDLWIHRIISAYDYLYRDSFGYGFNSRNCFGIIIRFKSIVIDLNQLWNVLDFWLCFKLVFKTHRLLLRIGQMSHELYSISQHLLRMRLWGGFLNLLMYWFAQSLI
jgi:hypothetical protein